MLIISLSEGKATRFRSLHFSFLSRDGAAQQSKQIKAGGCRVEWGNKNKNPEAQKKKKRQQ